MKKILVAVGSGLKGGNTDQLADAFIQGARENGHEVQKFFLGGTDLHGCMGCGACQKNGNRCAVKDVMQQIYPYLEECDTIVMASPLYFWTLSSQIKAFFDRMYALSKENIYPQKDTVLLMTSEDDTETTFDRPDSYYRFIVKALGWNNTGTYYAGGCHMKDGKKQVPERHLNGAWLLGKSM
ncbi:flavodoxin family protein [Blautia sp. HCP3S3_G3]|uniref:flavodoxin family protein n=1 Tax=Blautia sp. HCP3S3_G3 TaxID=3438913 RepID=UPI003F8ADE93